MRSYFGEGQGFWARDPSHSVVSGRQATFKMDRDEVLTLFGNFCLRNASPFIVDAVNDLSLAVNGGQILGQAKRNPYVGRQVERQSWENQAAKVGTDAFEALNRENRLGLAILHRTNPAKKTNDLCRILRAAPTYKRSHIILLMVRINIADIVAGF
jgi:hypothetical protein